jgi:hypothetical protein
MAKKTDMAGEMPPMPPDAMMAPAPDGGGQVMVQVPKDVFMGIHQLVVQLAQGMDAVALGIEEQSAAESGAMMPEMPPMPPDGGAEAPMPPMSPEDEAFLTGMAEEAMVRGR